MTRRIPRISTGFRDLRLIFLTLLNVLAERFSRWPAWSRSDFTPLPAQFPLAFESFFLALWAHFLWQMISQPSVIFVSPG